MIDRRTSLSMEILVISVSRWEPPLRLLDITSGAIWRFLDVFRNVDWIASPIHYISEDTLRFGRQKVRSLQAWSKEDKDGVPTRKRHHQNLENGRRGSLEDFVKNPGFIFTQGYITPAPHYFIMQRCSLIFIFLPLQHLRLKWNAKW